MTHFLLVYDQDKGRILEIQEFSDQERELALQRLFERERLERENPNLEIVLLASSSEKTLRQTHARYFESASELLARTAQVIQKST